MALALFSHLLSHLHTFTSPLCLLAHLPYVSRITHVHTFTPVCVSILISNSESCPILPQLRPRHSGHSPSLAQCVSMRMHSACICACMHALLCPFLLQVRHTQTLSGCVRPLPYPKLCGLRGSRAPPAQRRYNRHQRCRSPSMPE